MNEISPVSPLAAFDAALAALADASLEMAVDLSSKAEGLRAYARQARDPMLLDRSVLVLMEAQRRAGELLRKMAEDGERDAGKGGDRKSRSQKKTVKLEDIGLTKQQSHKWQELSGLSRAAFEERVQERQKEARRALDGSRAERQAAKKEKRASREEQLAEKQRALPEKRYGVIYADPEWRFEVFSRDSGLDRAADNHYPTSTLEDIMSRDVASIAADDCVLFMWVTGPMLANGFKVLDAWGFTYKSRFVWAKDRIGNGYWVRDNAEDLLIATRGDIPCPAMGDQFEALQAASVGEHSAKPERFAEIIESYFPNLPKIELNRRGAPRPGWDAWGNETGGASDE